MPEEKHMTVRLASRPAGSPAESDFEILERPVPEPEK
jgi:NADPH-dependent curcumin reductase CurA